MIRNKLAFSLIEIMVSTIILTVWLFGIYKLIWSNMLLLSNNETFVTAKTLNIPFRECLKSKSSDLFTASYISWSELSVNFWNDLLGCNLWSYNSLYTFSWITLNNEIFYLYWKITKKESTFIEMDLSIYNELTQNVLKKDNEKKLIIYP